MSPPSSFIHFYAIFSIFGLSHATFFSYWTTIFSSEDEEMRELSHDLNALVNEVARTECQSTKSSSVENRSNEHFAWNQSDEIPQKWLNLAQIHQMLQSGIFCREIVAKNPKAANIFRIAVECSRLLQGKFDENEREKIEKLLEKIQEMMDQIAKYEQINFVEIEPAKTGKNGDELWEMTKKMTKMAFTEQKGDGENFKEFWSKIFGGWKKVLDSHQFTKYQQKVKTLRGRRKKRFGSVVIGLMAACGAFLACVMIFFCLTSYPQDRKYQESREERGSQRDLDLTYLWSEMIRSEHN